jgi:Zn-dependent protease with chaperone function
MTAYPPSPKNADPRVLAPSASFKKQVGLVVSSILLFFFVYILLMLAAFALAAACFYFGGLLIINVPRFITIMIGLGLMALGISVVFFLIKFIFAVSKNENPLRIEIRKEEQPELFSFIRRLSKETGTSFPKKIFLTGEVNASVFYNSSFWSMFFPVKKNLEIGLGLVNCVNLSEFKAVIAHEFGHFSQRSMKLGSFTYNVNRVIYNILYNNTGYTAFLNSWGTVNRYFAFFANITVSIAQGIQWILRKMYGFINKNYLGLSREMEFHADAVSASVSGGNNLIAALSRIELAADCYNSALDNAGDWLRQKKATSNILNNQLTILQSMAKEYKLSLKEGIPEVPFHFIQSLSQSRINYKNQWASHPTLEERKAHLDNVAIIVAPDESIAWQLFSNREQLGEKVTERLYINAKTGEQLEIFDGSYFNEVYSKKRTASLLPDEYMGFYDRRFINVQDWNIDQLTEITPSKTFDELYNTEDCQLQSAITHNENDLATMKAIKAKQILLKTFDFDGTKHDVVDCDAVIAQLEEDIRLQKQKQQERDKEVFEFFYHHANGQSGIIRDKYIQYAVLSKELDEYTKIANTIMNTLNPFYQGGLKIEDVQQSVNVLKTIYEKQLIAFFKRLLDEKTITNATDNLADRMLAFNNNDYTYFAFEVFRKEEIAELADLALKVADELTQRKFAWYKKMLEEQLRYIKK